MSALKKWNKKKRGIKKMVEKIIELAKENLSIDGEITATSSFKEDLEVDSLDLMELVKCLYIMPFGHLAKDNLLK